MDSKMFDNMIEIVEGIVGLAEEFAQDLLPEFNTTEDMPPYWRGSWYGDINDDAKTELAIFNNMDALIIDERDGHFRLLTSNMSIDDLLDLLLLLKKLADK